LGFLAGYNVVSGGNNIYIGNLGLASESNTLRLGAQAGPDGTPGITRAFVAGIAGSAVTGRAVYVTSAGQLGVLASSERYKTDVAAMGASTEKLEQLRPVTFKLKTDPQGTVQYGLIAEEVDKVYPELVIRNAEGRIDGVRYEELTPMLLNEVQQQRHRIAAQEERISAQEERIAAQERQLREVQLQLAQVRQPRQQLTALEAPRAPVPVPQPSAPAADGH